MCLLGRVRVRVCVFSVVVMLCVCELCDLFAGVNAC